MAASLWEQIRSDLWNKHRVLHADHALLMRVQACSRANLPAFLARHRAPPLAELQAELAVRQRSGAVPGRTT